jgi:hypothetical protein
MRLLRSIALFAALLFTTIGIASCGGSNPDSPPAGTTTTTISGSVFAAPVAGASVVVLDSSGTTTIGGPVTTANDGTFTVTVPVSALSSALLISAVSGTYVDEATGVSTPAKEMAAYVAGGSLNAGPVVHLDPSSTIIAGLVRNHGRTPDQAKAAFSGALGFSPNAAVCPRNMPAASATAAQRLAALRAIAFSQLTKDLGLNPNDQFDLLTAVAEDLADGSLDGMNGAAIVSIGTVTTMPEDIANRLERSLVSLLSNTSVNLTGLSPAEIGTLPFGKTVLTNSYKVEYLPGMMPASQGKTSFKIKVTNRSDGSPAVGLSLSLMPKMYMATMSHMTPLDGTITESVPGTYSCTVYYLMASGMGMGYWELKVQIGGMGGETATFYPSVGMAMGSTTVRATLKGQSDMIGSMMSSSKRTYYLFKDGLASGATSTFNLFIAAQESMMSFPAISTLSTTTLHNESGTPWTVNSVTVQASTDGSTWSADAAETSTGHWSLSGLSGLVSGQTGTLYIKLNVNGEDKTTDGNAASGSNGYAVFTVTP